MLIQSTAPKKPQSKNNSFPAVKAEASEPEPNESLSLGEKKTPTIVKVGKYVLAAAATAGAASLAYFGATNLGTAAAVASSIAGGFAGATIFGAAGMIADVGGGIMGSGDATKPMTIAGTAIGLVGGGFVGSMVQSGSVGIGMGIAAGIAALALVSSATNIGAR